MRNSCRGTLTGASLSSGNSFEEVEAQGQEMPGLYLESEVHFYGDRDGDRYAFSHGWFEAITTDSFKGLLV